MVTKKRSTMALKRTPRNQSLLISLFVALVLVCGYLIQRIVPAEQHVITEIVFVVMAFTGSYFLVRFLFVRFIEKSVNPIFKAIHTVTMSQKDLRNKIDSGDITSELNSEVKLWADNQTQEIRKLKQMERYRKDFLGNVSHEMKTPIFNIQGYILTLLDGGMDDRKINRLYLERAERSINRLISIVDDLESISRLESGEFKLQLEKFNIVKLVEDLFESQEMLARNFKVKLEFDSNYSKPIKVLADRKRIQEVIGNLLVNSIKYGNPNGKTTVGFIDTGDTIMVDVSDDGIGISEEDLPRIFERFYRVDKSRSRDSGGTGLGLAIVKHVIQAHNQTINVRSKEGKGTSFVFSLEKA